MPAFQSLVLRLKKFGKGKKTEQTDVATTPQLTDVSADAPRSDHGFNVPTTHVGLSSIEQRRIRTNQRDFEFGLYKTLMDANYLVPRKKVPRTRVTIRRRRQRRSHTPSNHSSSHSSSATRRAIAKVAQREGVPQEPRVCTSDHPKGESSVTSSSPLLPSLPVLSPLVSVDLGHSSIHA